MWTQQSVNQLNPVHQTFRPLTRNSSGRFEQAAKRSLGIEQRSATPVYRLSPPVNGGDEKGVQTTAILFQSAPETLSSFESTGPRKFGPATQSGSFDPSRGCSAVRPILPLEVVRPHEDLLLEAGVCKPATWCLRYFRATACCHTRATHTGCAAFSY